MMKNLEKQSGQHNVFVKPCILILTTVITAAFIVLVSSVLRKFLPGRLGTISIYVFWGVWCFGTIVLSRFSTKKRRKIDNEVANEQD